VIDEKLTGHSPFETYIFSPLSLFSESETTSGWKWKV